MDSPEGFEPDPVTGHVFIALTGNDERKVSQINAGQSAAVNKHGHLLEMIPPMVAAWSITVPTFDWRVFLLCGDPANPADGASFHPGTSRNGWFVEPDNIGFDPAGRLWVCSDGPGPRDMDGLWAMQTAAPKRACRGCSTRRRSSRNAAAPPSRRMGRRCSCRCSSASHDALAGFHRWPPSTAIRDRYRTGQDAGGQAGSALLEHDRR
jgi:hypothetical protein